MLASFQREFAAALLSETPTGALARMPAFAVYPNTVMKAYVDALQANYPAVVRLVGLSWFRAAAAVYARGAPARQTCLLLYGADFADFLDTFEPAAALPYLPAVARLDRLHGEAHVAADAPVLEPGQLARFSPDDLAGLNLVIHPAVRWMWSESLPAYSIWSRQRTGGLGHDGESGESGDVESDTTVRWQSEGALITRAHDVVQWHAADAATIAFLQACARQACLAQAAEAALHADPRVDLAQLLAGLLRAGCFSSWRRT
jgi:hypothetical protein